MKRNNLQRKEVSRLKRTWLTEVTKPFYQNAYAALFDKTDLIIHNQYLCILSTDHTRKGRFIFSKACHKSTHIPWLDLCSSHFSTDERFISIVVLSNRWRVAKRLLLIFIDFSSRSTNHLNFTEAYTFSTHHLRQMWQHNSDI